MKKQPQPETKELLTMLAILVFTFAVVIAYHFLTAH